MAVGSRWSRVKEIFLLTKLENHLLLLRRKPRAGGVHCGRTDKFCFTEGDVEEEQRAKMERDIPPLDESMNNTLFQFEKGCLHFKLIFYNL